MIQIFIRLLIKIPVFYRVFTKIEKKLKALPVKIYYFSQIWTQNQVKYSVSILLLNLYMKWTEIVYDMF